jgi:ABC-type sugar transport system ATPase subunit
MAERREREALHLQEDADPHGLARAGDRGASGGNQQKVILARWLAPTRRC